MPELRYLFGGSCMKFGLGFVPIGLFLALAPADAVEAKNNPLAITGSTTVVSQYRYRGVSLSDERGAFQAGITATHQSGFYLDVWGSNLAGYGTYGGPNLEVDFTAGYEVEAKGLTLSIGVPWYTYPGTDGTDYVEPFASVSTDLSDISVSLAASYAPSQKAIGRRENWYVSGDIEAPLSGTRLSARGHLGYSTGQSTLTAAGNYADWLIGADYQWNWLTLGVAYVDTDIASPAAKAAYERNIVGGALILSLTASF